MSGVLVCWMCDGDCVSLCGVVFFVGVLGLLWELFEVVSVMFVIDVVFELLIDVDSW